MSSRITRTWVQENTWVCTSCGSKELGRYMKCQKCGSPKELGGFRRIFALRPSRSGIVRSRKCASISTPAKSAARRSRTAGRMPTEMLESCECDESDEDCCCQVCSYCLGEKVTDADLLKYALKRLGLTQETLVADFKEGIKKNLAPEKTGG